MKGNARTIGVNAKVPVGHCTAELDPATHTRSIAQWAIESGKSIGLVTTTRGMFTSLRGIVNQFQPLTLHIHFIPSPLLSLFTFSYAR